MHGLRLLLILAMACGSSSPKAQAKHPNTIDFDGEDEVDELADQPSPPKPIVVGDPHATRFEAPFPGVPLRVEVTTLEGAISSDQQPRTQRVDNDTKSILFAGMYIDPEQVRHVALVLAMLDVEWFEVTSATPPHPWGVWHSRTSSGSIVTVESHGQTFALRYIDGVQRVHA